jgi:hypothetical protein
MAALRSFEIRIVREQFDGAASDRIAGHAAGPGDQNPRAPSDERTVARGNRGRRHHTRGLVECREAHG